MTDNEKIEGLKWPSCEFCGKELELIRPHVFDECKCEGAIAKFKEDEQKKKHSSMTEDKKEPSAKTPTPEEYAKRTEALESFKDFEGLLLHDASLIEEVIEGKYGADVNDLRAVPTDLRNANQEIENLESELSDLKLRLSGHEANERVWTEQKASRDKTIEFLQGECDKLTDKLNGGESPEVTALREQVERLKQENERLKATFEILGVTGKTQDLIDQLATLQASHKELLEVSKEMDDLIRLLNSRYRAQFSYVVEKTVADLFIEFKLALANASKLTK